MNRNKEFIINTIILFIGKFATQFMSILLLPLYTHYLLKEDYGLVDLFQTYISLFIPVLTLRVDSATFRFLIDQRNNENGKKEIISNIVIILLGGLFITILIAIWISLFVHIKYYSYLIVNLLIMIISSIFLQILRGLGKNKAYSIASIIVGIITLTANTIFIIVLKKGAESILISSSIANLFCILFVILNTKLFNYIDFRFLKSKKIYEILKYSFPMIPNALSWWVINVSDRTIISIFLGVAFNALYAVSCKFSNILNSIFSIVNMSWQETTSLHINDIDKEKFFSDMINDILFLFGSISLLIIVFLPFVYDYLIGTDYVSSYEYIPLLLYANLGNVLSGLVSGIYIALKRTKEIAYTTIISAVINIIIDLLLIRYIGLYAAVLSTLIAYLVISIYRFIDCQKYVKVRLSISNVLLFTIIFICSYYIYYVNNIFFNIINLIFIMIYCFIINRKYILFLIDKVKKLHKIIYSK